MKSLSSLNLPKNLEISADGENKLESLWTGAVVFLFVQDNLLLIKRSETMPSHRGQMAFVGGHKQGDENPWETAQREFNEETGLSQDLLNFEGVLDLVQTSTRSRIFPVVCSLDMEPSDFISKIESNGEWDEAILYPFKNLLRFKRWSFAKGVMEKHERLIKFYPIMRNNYISSSGDVDRNHLLWGATAKMIWNFFNYYHEDVK